MRKIMKRAALICCAATAVFALLHHMTGAFLGWLITMSTFSYHLLARLLIGFLFNCIMKNRANADAWWYRQKKWEYKLYDLLRVGHWKGNMPTYDPDAFDPKKHTWDEIAQAMCQAELVHETNAAISFLPFVVCILCHGWEDIPVFLVTSVLAALFDLCFVIMQRYNRPRIVRLAERMEKRKNKQRTN